MQSQNRQLGTLDQLESWLETARSLGFRIRHDHFGGSGGGVCEFAGQKWLFMDVSISPIEQLEMLEREIPKDLGYQRAA